MVFGTFTGILGTNTVAFGTKEWYLGQKTVLFGKNKAVFGTKTVVVSHIWDKYRFISDKYSVS